MKPGWEMKKLGEVCDFQNGFAFKSSTYKSAGTPLLRIRNIQNNIISDEKLTYIDETDYSENLERFKVIKGDLVIAMSGATTGKLGLNLNDHVYYMNQRVGKFIPKGMLSKSYLFYFLTTKAVENLNISAGAAQPNLSTDQIKKIEIPVPSIQEQKQIVEILDKAFALIDKAKANIEKNLQNARELFQSELDRIFSQKGEDWEEKKLGEVCEFVRGPFGGSLKKNIFKPDGYAVYEQQHAIYDQFTNIRYYINNKKFDEMKRFEVKPGDLIMSCSGTMGRIAIVPDNVKKGIINQALLKLTPVKNLMSKFLKSYMKSVHFQDSLKANSLGTAIKNVASVKVLKTISLPVPPLQEQNVIVHKLDELSTKTQKLEAVYQRKLNCLEELKKSILHKAFSGELSGIEEELL